MHRRRVIYILAALLLSVVLLFTAVELVAFDINHYLKAYHRYDVPRETGMDMAALESVTYEIMDYLRCRQQQLNPQALVNGQQRHIFGERERLHMVDVKNLFLAGRHIRNAALGLMVALGLLLVWKDRRWHRHLARLLVGTLMVNLVLLIVVVIGMLVDFNLVFTWFHLLLFDNDLWQLSEASLLLRMVPEIFFFHTALKIGAIYLGTLMLLAAAGAVWLRWPPRN